MMQHAAVAEGEEVDGASLAMILGITTSSVDYRRAGRDSQFHADRIRLTSSSARFSGLSA